MVIINFGQAQDNYTEICCYTSINLFHPVTYNISIFWYPLVDFYYFINNIYNTNCTYEEWQIYIVTIIINILMVNKGGKVSQFFCIHG